jgi:hypothetical protein
MWAVLSTIFGGLVSIGAVIVVESLRRPSLQLSKEDPPLPDQTYSPEAPATVARFLRVTLSNRTPPWFARWVTRLPALQCRAAITFHHSNDEGDIFGRAMEGRWSNTPEPLIQILPVPAMPGTPAGQIAVIPQLRNWVDVYPGESETLDIVIRAGDDAECYGWNNEAYPSWRNQRWKLAPAPGRYLARVVVTSMGLTRVRWFQIENSAGRESFRLEDYRPRFRR